MSYDIRWCVETVMPDVEGDCHAVVHTPRFDSPTYNYSKMFRACMDWDYKQGEMGEDGNIELGLSRNGKRECFYDGDVWTLADIIDEHEQMKEQMKKLKEHGIDLDDGTLSIKLWE